MQNLWKLGLTSFFTDISTEMVFPFLGIYFTMIGLSPLLIGLIEGIAEGISYAFRLVSGIVADYTQKRKRLALAGYSLSFLGKLLFLTGIPAAVSSGRWLDRLGKGIRTAPRDSLIAESLPENQKGRAFGFHRFFDTLGAFLGVGIALLVTVFWQDLSRIETIQKLILFSLFPSLLGIVILFSVKDTGLAKTGIWKNRVLESWSFLKNQKKLKLFFLVHFLFALANSSDQFLFIKANTVHGDLRLLLWAYLLFNLSYVLVAYPAGKLSDRIPRKYVIAAGYGIYSAVYFFVPRMETNLHFFAIMFFYGLHRGIVESAEKALIVDLAGDYRGTALGIASFLYGLGVFLASTLAGVLWKIFGIDSVFYFDAILALAVMLFLLLFFK